MTISFYYHSDLADSTRKTLPGPQPFCNSCSLDHNAFHPGEASGEDFGVQTEVAGKNSAAQSFFLRLWGLKPKKKAAEPPRRVCATGCLLPLILRYPSVAGPWGLRMSGFGRQGEEICEKNSSLQWLFCPSLMFAPRVFGGDSKCGNLGLMSI